MEHAICYPIALASVVWALYLVFLGRRSAMRDLAGPPSPSWVFGHLRQLLLSAPYGVHEFNWLDSYGSVYALKGCFGQDRLMVADPLAMQYILNSGKFRRSIIIDSLANLLFGEKSVIVVRGNEHRRLRSALNVGFTAAAVRSYLSVFKQVAERISDQFEHFPATATDICSVLSAATLNAISQAILGRSTQDLGDEFVANNVELIKLTASQSEAHIIAEAIGSHLPTWVWRAAAYFPTAAASVARKGRSLCSEIGGRIIREKLDAAAKGLENDSDLFSTLLNPDRTSGKTTALTEQDIIAQIPVIVSAGQDTTANALAFGLLELASHPGFQDKLRTEIYSYSNLEGNSAGVAYDNMPLLNAFIKETLRLYPAEPLIHREVLEDTVIPLGGCAISSGGKRITQIPVRKGEVVTMAIASYQRLASRWGKNAHAFHPSRWLDCETYQADAVGPYANLLSFFGGSHTCLGWRFAQVISFSNIAPCLTMPKKHIGDAGHHM
ncbi:cytochrome P450 [Mycena galopus ATCC 62051]|nr:cytochrome P450 [Mycena galopus ATCC 62051]